MWIDERNIEGGPIGWLTEHFSDPVNTFASVAYILANFLMDGMLVSLILYSCQGKFTNTPTMNFGFSCIGCL